MAKFVLARNKRYPTFQTEKAEQSQGQLLGWARPANLLWIILQSFWRVDQTMNMNMNFNESQTLWADVSNYASSQALHYMTIVVLCVRFVSKTCAEIISTLLQNLKIFRLRRARYKWSAISRNSKSRKLYSLDGRTGLLIAAPLEWSAWAKTAFFELSGEHYIDIVIFRKNIF